MDITYRTDGDVFKLSRLGAKSKVKTVTIVDIQYADDSAVVAHSELDLQNTFNALVDAYRLFGLSVNATKKKFYISRHNHQLQHYHQTVS